MPNYSSECQPIANMIKGLQGDVAAFQKTLQNAAPGEKAFLLSQIAKAEGQIAKEQGLLDDCIKKHPYKPPAPPPKNPCLGIKKQENDLQNQLELEIDKAIAPLQKELQNAPAPAKAGILHQIETLRAQIKATSPLSKQIAIKEKEYDDCLISHGGLLPMNAKFKGKATMRTDNSHAKGPFKQDITIGLRFGAWDHSYIEITDFPSISVTYDTHSVVGTVTTTVSLTSGSGRYDPKTHSVSINLDLYFEHSTSLAGPSSLKIELTGNKPLASDGSIDVFGGAKFQGGYLGGNEASIDVSGKISPHP